MKNGGNCNVNAESVPVSRLHARADAHAAPRRTAGTGPAPGTAPAAALDLDARGLDVALLIAVVEDDIAGAVPTHALHRSRVKFTGVLEFGLALVSFSGRRRALRAPRAASRTAPGPRPTPTAQDLDALQFYALLGVSVVEANIIGIIGAMDALDLALVPLAAAFIIGLDGVALAGLLRRGAPVVLGIRVERLDELRLDAGLVLPIFIADVIGPVAPITANLARIELTSAACEL